MLKCFAFSYKRHFTFILVIFMSIKCLYTAINIVNPALNICQGEKPMWRILPSWNVHLSRVLRHYRIADIIIQFVHCVRSFPLYTFETKGNKTCKEERKDVIVANKNWIFASAAQLGKKENACTYIVLIPYNIKGVHAVGKSHADLSCVGLLNAKSYLPYCFSPAAYVYVCTFKLTFSLAKYALSGRKAIIFKWCKAGNLQSLKSVLWR